MTEVFDIEDTEQANEDTMECKWGQVEWPAQHFVLPWVGATQTQQQIPCLIPAPALALLWL